MKVNVLTAWLDSKPAIQSNVFTAEEPRQFSLVSSALTVVFCSPHDSPSQPVIDLSHTLLLQQCSATHRLCVYSWYAALSLIAISCLTASETNTHSPMQAHVIPLALAVLISVTDAQRCHHQSQSQLLHFYRETFTADQPQSWSLIS